ncbi:branched-chain amino acid ABC transporter permease [Mesorhizobium sp. CN2-181]|uniref:branched-chain amino acid ABC transporter permease n=1 Tax=Mesorhizobium yinganensis TaxID=3157707 RepID=UPI0032B814B3
MSQATFLLFLEQCLNGLQFGIMLFLITAGLTLVVGIMNFVNLAQGSLFMLGAFVAAWFASATGNYYLAVAVAVAATAIIGALVEVLALSRFYRRPHLDQVLATFGFILIFNEVVRVLWGSQGLTVVLPPELNLSIELLPGLTYPLFRFVFIVFGLAVAAFLYVLIARTRVGMLIRAGASDREMVRGLGVNIGLLFTFVFGLGAALAGLAGSLSAPIMSASVGMGEPVLILGFVVIVIGGIGSIRGAFWAALLVGFIDTLGRSYATSLISLIFGSTAASSVGPSLSGMMIYILMATVLAVCPEGLFRARAS